MANRALIGVLVAMAWGLANADNKAPEAVIQERLKQARPDIALGEVEPSPIEGLYQVQIQGGPLLYVSANGEKVLVGDLLEVGPNGFTRYQDPELIEQRKQLVKTLGDKDSIAFEPKGGTEAVVYVFTDVDCGYCRRLHQQLDTYQAQGEPLPGYRDYGIEIRYLAYPRAGVPSGSAKKLETAWCAENRQETLDKLKNLQSVEPVSCEDNPVAEHYQLGRQVGVNGTPALLLPDGQMVAGYVPPQDLARTLGLE